MCDLQVNVVFRGFNLNQVTQDADGISGCLIETIDHSEVELRQFIEPLSLQDGIDVGGVWWGARHVRITGTVFGKTRQEAYESIEALDAVMLPESATFGDYELPLTDGTYMVRPNGLRVVWDRRMYGGDSPDNLAIPWSVTMVTRDPHPVGGGGGG